MLTLKFYLMVKKKAKNSDRSPEARGSAIGDKPEEPQGSQDRERHPEPDDGDINAPGNIVAKKMEARDQSNRPRSEPHDSRHRSRH